MSKPSWILLAPQGLDLGRAIEPQESAEGSGVAFFELLGALDTQQRHQEQCQHPLGLAERTGNLRLLCET